MTTQIKISHEGGNKPVEIFDDGTRVAKLEQQGDYFVTNIYGARRLVVKEESQDPPQPTHDDSMPMRNGPDEEIL